MTDGTAQTPADEAAPAAISVEVALGELKERMFWVESLLNRVLVNQTQFQVQVAALLGRIDRFEERFARIERGLDRAGGRW